MTEKENHLPNLSSEERAHALELAMQARRRYAALKARMKSGELTFTDAMDEKDAKRILVASLLQSVPGIGASKMEFIMRLYRIPKSRRLETRLTRTAQFVMYPNWEHWRDLKGTCPVCGKPSHVGASMRTGRYYWLHDDYDIREYYREHGKHSSLAEISFDVFQEMIRCAREHGIEPVATIGGTEAVSKRVRCIEIGKEYRSIQDAADDVQRSRASLSSAIKRSGTCAGCHWALV